jgi:predicted nucleic acid-binding protein
MPTRHRAAPPLLVDTSVAVALVVSDHRHHDATYGALDGRRLGLAGHAAFETFSVLTRLPPPARRTPATVARLIAATFPDSRFLGEAAGRALLSELEAHRIAGGSVYDALVGAAANEHGCALATRDRRALDTYRALGVRIEVIE